MVHKARVKTTVSNDPWGKGRHWASPTRRSTSTPSSAARLRGDFEHRRTQLHAGEMGTFGVVGEVPARADGYLQHLAAGSGARPFAAAAEKQPFGDAD